MFRVFCWVNLETGSKYPKVTKTSIYNSYLKTKTTLLFIPCLQKLMEPKRNLILDAKRSNAINIAMKKLPTPQTIKAAIMKMDATVIGREGIEKLLTMLPTDEEKVKIQEAQVTTNYFGSRIASCDDKITTLSRWINDLSTQVDATTHPLV